MNTRFFIAVWGLVSLAAHAQPAPKPPAFQSAFEGYQPYTDDKSIDWKAANDTAAQIGGWRAYAKQASAADTPMAVTAPPSPAAPMEKAPTGATKP